MSQVRSHRRRWPARRARPGRRTRPRAGARPAEPRPAGQPYAEAPGRRVAAQSRGRHGAPGRRPPADRPGDGARCRGPGARAARIALSTASVYPEDCADAFAIAPDARLRRGRGHGLDRPGQPGRRRPRGGSSTTTSSPCSRSTRRPCSSRSGSGGASRGRSCAARAEHGARARGADGRRPPAVPLAARVRGGVRRRASPARGRDGVRLAVENMYPWRARGARAARLPARAGTRVAARRTEHVTLDLSHTATAGSDALAMARGPRRPARARAPRRRQRARAKDEHLVPGQGDAAVRRAARACWPSANWTGTVVVEVNTRRAEDPASSARPTWPRPSRSPGCTSRPAPSR